MFLSNGNDFIGKYCKIIDKKTKKLVAMGEIIFLKEETRYCLNQPILISFDNKFFYIKDGTKKYDCVFSNKQLEFYQNIPSNYIIKSYKKFKKPPYTADVYRDWGMDELDEPVKPLVYALNKIEGIKTSGSCCGHFCDNLWVAMHISDEGALKVLEYMISKFKKEFRIKVKCKASKNRLMMIELISYKKGYTAYRHALKLANYIEQQVAIF